ncbi:MAG: ComF family protein [Pseudomonadota bacterium]
MSGSVGCSLQLLTEFTAKICDILIPPICVSCFEPLDRHHSLCAQCWRDVSFISEPICHQLGIPLPFDPGGIELLSAAALAQPPVYDRARAATHFSGTVRNLLHRFKYGDQHTARRLFMQWLLFAGRDVMAECDLVVPVPLHRQRLMARRFNQAAILAQDVALAGKLEFQPEVLKRERPTLSQVGLTRDQRRRNLQGAFAVPGKTKALLSGKSVLLVDDVITTGTTIESCARVLKRAGAKQVNVVAVAMVTDDSRINI